MPGSPNWSLTLRFPHQHCIFTSLLPHMHYGSRKFVFLISLSHTVQQLVDTLCTAKCKSWSKVVWNCMWYIDCGTCLQDHLFFVLEYMSGGDLRHQLTEVEFFSHRRIKFSTIWSSHLLIGSSSQIRHLCWHLLSLAGNTCLSIQSLVPQITVRCHFLLPTPPISVSGVWFQTGLS
jgi:serine/threonine protein kinase